jgi:hypothetical protein
MSYVYRQKRNPLALNLQILYAMPILLLVYPVVGIPATMDGLFHTGIF